MPIPEHITHTAAQKEKPSSPQEEASKLQKKVEEKQEQFNNKESYTKHEAAKETVQEYAQEDSEDVLDSEYTQSKEETERLALDLAPEEHDARMKELLKKVKENGIKNTLSVVREMEDKHIEDDFHRVLVEYLKEDNSIEDLEESSQTAKALDMRLFEVVLPRPQDDEQQKGLSEMISAMEQFYAGMSSVTEDNRNGTDYFTLELATRQSEEQLAFYCAVHESDADLFEKQLTSVFPRAKILLKKDDYNSFHVDGESVISKPEYANDVIFPIKLYEDFDHDPLNGILNAFSKLDEKEGLAIQLAVRPADGKYADKFKEAVSKIENGVDVDDAIDIAYSTLGDISKEMKKEIKRGFMSLIHGESDEEDESGMDTEAQEAVEQIQEKLDSPIFSVNIRFVASAEDTDSANHALSNLESAFKQFANTKGHTPTFQRLAGQQKEKALHRFTFRLFYPESEIPLNTTELTTLFHFPVTESGSRELKESNATRAPAPVDLPDDGTLIGVNEYRGDETEVRLTESDRVRHFYTIGQTGTGKTNLLKNMIQQDIKNGDGCCFVDPHGGDAEEVLAHVPPERFDDVIYFDPAYTKRPFGLNMLEYDPQYPEQKTFVVNEMMSIFDKLFDLEKTGGPMFEQYFRNGALLALEGEKSNATILEISRVLSDDDFRQKQLAKSSNAVVNQFWKETAEQAGGEASLENIVPYITSKFDNFLSNEIMRPIIAQRESAFDFRQIMDNQKILIVNLSKGRLGDINANLIGLILVGKILMAALSRVDMPKDEREPFYLYMDEFQNISTDSISAILSEARKYQLSLNVAHQYIDQLDDDIRDAVFGNVGNMAVHRISSKDAETMEDMYQPVFDKTDLMNVDNYNYFANILVHGEPVEPFSARGLPPTDGNKDQVEKLKELSYRKYGRRREEVEKEVRAKMAKIGNTEENVDEDGLLRSS